MAERLRLKIRDEQGRERLDAGLVARLLAELEAAGEATLVTLESEGQAFCEGMDLGALTALGADAAAALETYAMLLRAIERTPRPVVALVNGPAMGGGVGLLAAADIVIASPRATFALPEALFGIIPATVFPLVARRVGPARARWLALTGIAIPAEEAWRIGLVDELSDDPEAALARHARRWDRMDARALAEVKALSAAYNATPRDYHETAGLRFRQLLESPETRRRIDRFLSGKTPWPEGHAR
ncbi:MAG TPA: enoyl-CoA hydratase/isomerase family protein [Longimicrobiales bacterium]|nr:enoyl-CoA hydratase/isomerase family protein [Longimicrobiales bacterium]